MTPRLDPRVLIDPAILGADLDPEPIALPSWATIIATMTGTFAAVVALTFIANLII